MSFGLLVLIFSFGYRVMRLLNEEFLLTAEFTPTFGCPEPISEFIYDCLLLLFLFTFMLLNLLKDYLAFVMIHGWLFFLFITEFSLLLLLLFYTRFIVVSLIFCTLWFLLLRLLSTWRACFFRQVYDYASKVRLFFGCRFISQVCTRTFGPWYLFRASTTCLLWDWPFRDCRLFGEVCTVPLPLCALSLRFWLLFIEALADVKVVSDLFTLWHRCSALVSRMNLLLPLLPISDKC